MPKQIASPQPNSETGRWLVGVGLVTGIAV